MSLGDWLFVDAAVVIIAAWAIYEGNRNYGRHRQAATAVQGDPADGAGSADARTAASGAANRAVTEWANSPAGRAYARATGRTRAGVMMAKINPVPITTASLTAVLPCQVCGMPGAGLGGLCNRCAAGAGAGIWGRTCPQCGTNYTTNDAACPSCMSRLMKSMQLIQIAQSQAALTGGILNTAVNPPPTPLPRADMQVRDLIGWRVWRITSLGYLRSLTADAIWMPGVPMEASEVVDRHAASKTGGSDLGIHVFAERNAAILEAENYHSNSARQGGGEGFSVGSVLLWGEVVEHERGYRAERAKIKSIDDVTWKGKPPWDKETAEVLGFLRARYGVGVVDKEPSV